MSEVYLALEEYPFTQNSFVTLGAFDGIHFGHRQIISRLISEAKTNGGVSVLITFNPHPQEVIQKGPAEFRLLTTLTEKLSVLKQTGIDRILVLPFTRDFSELSPEDFIEKVLAGKIGVKKIWLGYDHGFGRNRQGSARLLEEFGTRLGFSVETVQPQEKDGVVVSSTGIRNLIREGRIREANQLLGYEYSLSGIVSRGDRIGRTIGFPTANIFPENPRKLLPSNGVYIVGIVIRGILYDGICNIGFRPTYNGRELKTEVHILDYSEDIYGLPVCVRFLERLRDEKKFSGSDELRSQIKLDETIARAWLAKQKLK